MQRCTTDCQLGEDSGAVHDLEVMHNGVEPLSGRTWGATRFHSTSV